MSTARGRLNRGFTLVEMITSVAIVGLILVLIGYEFDASLGNLIHTRSNRDMESNARVVMSKVTNRLRSASPWVFNPSPPPTGSHQVILSPVPATSPPATSNVLQFYRVRPGSLVNAGGIHTDADGLPDPPYDIVTIQRSTCPTIGCTDPSPNYLVESAVDAQTLAQTEPPMVLGKDVTNFLVTATGPVSPAQVDISLTVASTSSRCDAKCSYTTNSSIWVGGDFLANQ
jgi:prepilin-type N-terminal cleavage/methylation domain-containing protein